MTDYFKRLTLDELCDYVARQKRTLILFHVRPDADAIGSAFALREILRVMGIPAYCACSDEIPERLTFLADGVQGSVLLDGELRLDYERVISVDSASPSQLGELFVRIRRDVDVMIDHHAKGSVYADNYVDAEAAATGEIIYLMAKRMVELGYLEAIPPRALNCIYAAISADTGSFRYANTTPSTMRIAAELIEQGVDFTRINTLLYDCKSAAQLRAEGEGIKRLRLYGERRISGIVFPYSIQSSLGVSYEHLDTLIDIARSVNGIELAFVIKQPNSENSFRISMRSSGNIDVAEICASFGGGGHRLAAGCTVTANSAEDAEEKLLREIMKIL